MCCAGGKISWLKHDLGHVVAEDIMGFMFITNFVPFIDWQVYTLS